MSRPSNTPNSNKAIEGQPKMPDIKFHQVLAELIAESPYNNHRRAIWEHAGVSSAALSQYALGRARPRFETLCLLADFFGVTLDFLVLGKEDGSNGGIIDERQSMAHYVDWTLADVRERTSAHTWFVTRIGQAMAERIDEVAKEVLPRSPQAGDILTDNDIVRLERLSVHSKMIAPNLDYDLLTAGEEVLPGRFARIAAANLNQGRQYQVLLPNDSGKEWDSVMHAYRKLFVELGVSTEKIKQYRFLTTNMPFFTGVYMFQVDLVKLAREDPFFSEAVRPYVSQHNWIGFTRHEHMGAPGPGVLYEPLNLERSLASFDQLWGDAQRIRMPDQEI